MFFCTQCGKEVKDEAVVCSACGCEIGDKTMVDKGYNESKFGIGVLFFFLLPRIIGLIIGLAIYPKNTIARKTFLKGWLTPLFIILGITFVLIIISAFVSLFY